MSTANLSIEKQDNKLAISFKVLLGLYIIIPICVLVYIADQYYWNSYIKSMLPNRPSHFILLQILFGTPHIIASSIILISNKEYLHYYKNKLLIMTVLIIAVFGIGSLFIPYRALYIAAACWTVYHVFKQQHGIAKGLCRLPNWGFYWLLWISVAAGIFIYIGVFLHHILDAKQTQWVQMIAFVLTGGLLLSTVLCQRYITHSFGKCFLWANTLLIVSSFFMYSQQYYFLAILIPRLVHDSTAYIFYISHDYNKHYTHRQNILYKFAKYLYLPIWLFLPILSFALAYLLQAYGDELINMLSVLLFSHPINQAISLGLIGYLSLMHYYTESFTWQANSPLRRYIRFAGK